MIELPDRQLLVVVASHSEWLGRSLESVFDSNGYAVLRAEGGRHAYKLALSTDPDALFLESSLPEMDGVEICQALRQSPGFDPTVPIFVTSSGPGSSRERGAAYEAGAWDFCSHPVDTGTLLQKLATFMKARERLKQIEAGSLVDQLTGLYNAEGLHQWAAKLGARASRGREALACVAISPPATAYTDGGDDAFLPAMADFCRAQARKSDIVGYLGEGRFAILAPETDGAGAGRLAERLGRAHGRSSTASSNASSTIPFPGLRSGFYAVEDYSSAGIGPDVVIDRATMALSVAVGQQYTAPLSFDEIAMN